MGCKKFALYCNKYNHIRSDLIYILENICSRLKHNFTIGDKVQLLLAYTNEYNIKKRHSSSFNSKKRSSFSTFAKLSTGSQITREQHATADQ